MAWQIGHTAQIDRLIDVNFHLRAFAANLKTIV
jgi:hypothetical protein